MASGPSPWTGRPFRSREKYTLWIGSSLLFNPHKADAEPRSQRLCTVWATPRYPTAALRPTDRSRISSAFALRATAGLERRRGRDACSRCCSCRRRRGYSCASRPWRRSHLPQCKKTVLARTSCSPNKTATAMVARSRPPSCTHATLRDVRAEPFRQLRSTPPARDVAHCNSDSLLLPNENDKPLASCDPGVEQITLQHCVVLRHHRNNRSRVFLALALVDARGVCRHEPFVAAH